ncbi:hypothetical protein LQR31_09085 [Chromobacterium vaccinii]|uniref:hypothetical protein n=1 Tax=Chromobacterium vaccinii TaxID=1108595 RepID=UPI001E5F7F2F|nr:hypothetical protein [Chromobacterium vaccinii]MCD4484622.1 hypothetical protein [Chromobacterium vaccinii]
MEAIKNSSIVKSLIPSETPQEPSETRKFLHDSTIDSLSVFGKAVNAINGNLASHGDNNITKEKARSYATDTEKVDKNEMSNSAAFANSAAGWAKEGNGVGVVLNTLGMLASGPIDRAKYHNG